MQFKYCTIEDVRLQQSGLEYLRREGTYQLMWYLHILGLSTRCRLRQGYAMANDRFLPIVLADDGTILMQSDQAAGLEKSIDELDNIDEVWRDNWGNTFREHIGLFMCSLRRALLHSLNDSPAHPAQPCIPTHRPARSQNKDEAVANTMVRKDTAHANDSRGTEKGGEVASQNPDGTCVCPLWPLLMFGRSHIEHRVFSHAAVFGARACTLYHSSGNG